MGAARRLQNEIEAVLKKVKEGVTSFDDTHTKLMSLDAPQQREKLVASLKDQIKKLQKDRDKIKTWASDKDVRDKKHLTEARAMIERRMEKFKECEKDLKVKDFSKVGLEKGAKLDPKQAALDERREWIRNCVDRIEGTVEINEAELDGILANVKRGKEPPARVGRIQARNALHKKHTERLEQVLRALDNEAISVDQVDGLKEAIEDYLENGNVSDQDDFYDDVDLFYDEDILSIIDSVDVHVPIVTERVVPRVPDHTEKADKKKERELEKARKEEREKEREKEKNEKLAAAARSALVPPAKGHTAYPAEEKAAAAQQRVSPLAVTQPPPPPPPRTGSQPAAQANQPGTPVPASQQPEAASTAVRAATAPLNSAWVGATPSAASTAAPASSVSTVAPSIVDSSPVQPTVAAGAPGLPSPTPAATAAPPAPHHLAASAAPPGLPGKAAVSQELPSRVEPTASVPVTAQMPPLEPGSIMMTLQDKRPHPFDSVWLRHRCARRTRATAPRPPSYPSVPPAILDNPRFYTNITKDTDLDLFYIFYLTPGTQYQYLAACELRQRNWRYHKEEKAWFQRAEMPSESTATFERGDYVYFDPTCQTDTSWVLRFKKDFKVLPDKQSQSQQ